MYIIVDLCILCIIVVEFIYAQSPAYMKGSLLGCLFFVEGLAMTLGSLLFISQSKTETIFWTYFRSISVNDYCCSEVETGSCLSSYVIFTIITFLGILLFCFSAKKYKTRVRGRALQYYM